jgi:hypothetical protein
MAPAWKIEVSPDSDGIVRVSTTTLVGIPTSALDELTTVIYKALATLAYKQQQV